MQEGFIRRTSSKATSNRPWGKMLNTDKSRRAKVKKDTGLNQHWTDT